MGMDLGSGKSVRSDINVTPLVDVVLVLLIIFMVVTPMLQKGKMVDLPKAEHVATRKEDRDHPVEPIVLAVKNDGTFWVDHDELKPEEITARVEEEHNGAPERPILVKADKDAEYGKVRKLLKSLEEAGIQGASLAAAKLDDEGGAAAGPAGEGG